MPRLPMLKLLDDGKSRLFIDPASRSSGWAFFRGNELIDQGTVIAVDSHDVFKRLEDIYISYWRLAERVSAVEVHIESMPRMVSHFCMWSVGVIGTAVWRPSRGLVKDDIWVQSWQKVTAWKGNRESMKLGIILRLRMRLLQSVWGSII